MKKFFTAIIACVLSLLVFMGVSACKGGSWGGTTMNGWGAVDSSENGGFLVETENYLYFINGIGVSTADNTFGTPMKGALMAADKNDLSKTQVVVPKLFVASDYNAGLYIFGNAQNAYVYYGTPSTDKNNSGAIANDELTFMRTKLNGTASETFFTVDSLSAEYRFLEKDGKVYLIYYDTENEGLYAYDTASKSKTLIAKTNDKENVKTDGEYRTLDKYYFTDDGIIFTTTVYKEEYYSSAAQQSSYSRLTASYNQVYKYSAGDALNGALAGTVVLDGKADDALDCKTYAVNMIKDGYIYYTETLGDASTKTYACQVSALGNAAAEIKNESAMVENNLIVALDEVYYVSGSTVYRTTLLEKNTGDAPVMQASDISSLLFKDGDDIYYLNASQSVSRKKINDADAKQIYVTDVMIATAWYDYELVTIGGEKYFMYCDGSSTAASYVRYIKLGAEIGEEDTDEDGETDRYYLKGNATLGKKTASDEAQTAISKINAIGTSALKYQKNNGVITSSVVEEARAAYDALSSAAKECVTAATLKKLTNAEKALEIITQFDKLTDIEWYDSLTEAEQTALRTIYTEQVKPAVTALGDNEWTIRAYVSNNLNACYQKAQNLFED